MNIDKNIHMVFLRKDETIPPLFSADMDKEIERYIRHYVAEFGICFTT